jgi:hypothetical protein
MNGELLLNGFKFPEKLTLNLQNMTVLTGEDSFLAFEIFNMLESYFSRKNFSDYYLDNNTVLVLNGNKLSGSEFVVFRLSPVANIAEELRLSKKSLLGQAMQVVLDEHIDSMPDFIMTLQNLVLNPLNAITSSYGVSFGCENPDIFTISKILQPVIKEAGGQEILQQELNQFQCKTMLLDLITRIKTTKKKLLLIELPEYGLTTAEINQFFKMLIIAPLDNVILYTRRYEIYKQLPQIFNYNVLNGGKLYGFDDYDELEKELQQVLVNSSLEDIQKKVIEYAFYPEVRCSPEAEFIEVVDRFFNWNSKKNSGLYC